MRVSNHAGGVGWTSDRPPASPVVAMIRAISVAGGVTGVAPKDKSGHQGSQLGGPQGRTVHVNRFEGSVQIREIESWSTSSGGVASPTMVATTDVFSSLAVSL